MSLRFYIRKWDDDDRYYVFMGDEGMKAKGNGLLIQSVGYLRIAEELVKQYTKQFNLMVDREAATIV